jgi:hypothetical protein
VVGGSRRRERERKIEGAFNNERRGREMFSTERWHDHGE